jgi:hypothetical protein
MRVALIQLGGAASAVVLVLLLMTAPVKAEDAVPGMTAVATEELDRRSKPPEPQGGGLSESSVRVMMTYAFSLIPAEVPGPDGKPVKVDKTNPNEFFLPSGDARGVIRAATRSAYADACSLPDLAQANYKALIASEEARKVWSAEQLLMIEALHLFAVSYFTGNAKITEAAASPEDGASSEGDDAGAAASQPDSGEAREVEAPPPPECPPEQKQKVTNAINAYVKAARATPGQ